MVTVKCIKENEIYAEKIGEVYYLDQNRVYSIDGEWYGEFYKIDAKHNFICIGIRLLNRFERYEQITKEHKIFYNHELEKWECANCGATYYPHEIQRIFDYGLNPTPEIIKENKNNICFIPCHCMDCGIKWEKFEL